jgi:hypothetical protein
MLPSVVTKEKRPEAVAMRTACKIKTNKKKHLKGQSYCPTNVKLLKRHLQYLKITCPKKVKGTAI